MSTRTTELRAKDKAFVWHPFTQMRDWMADDPIVIERADGNHLIDTDGHRFLDGVSSLWTNVHGHRKPEIDAAVREQLDKVAHSTLLGLANVPSIELAERLVAIAPKGLSKVFYSDSGSSAVEIALKMAFQYWRHRGRPEKKRFVALTDAYHGDTIGSVSVGGMDVFHETFRLLLFDVLRAPAPAWYHHPEAPDPVTCRDLCLRLLERLFEDRGPEIAGFILEPIVMGAAGIQVQPHGYLTEVAALCRKHDVLLICDEVATGFGRTGTMFACEHEDVHPDLLCLAKGISGGYLPLAATLATDAIHDAFLGDAGEMRQFFHGHTYTGNPLACAAGLASLALFDSEHVLERVRERTALLASEMEARLAPHPHVGQIRQRGLMVGIELVADRATRTPLPPEAAVGARVCRAARALGVLLRPLGNVVVLMPPLSVTADEVKQLVAAVAHGLAEVF